MNFRSITSANLLLISWLLLGCLCGLLPEESREKIRIAMTDFTQPGLKLATHLPELNNTFSAASTGERRSAEFEELVSRLQRESVALKAQLREREKNSYSSEATESLFQPRLLEARLIRSDQKLNWKLQQKLSIGSQAGVAEDDWILKAEEPLIDLGADHNLQPDALLLAGKQVIGQLKQVGHRASSYRPIHDPQFRCPAQIIKGNQTEYRLSAIGSWHGTGDETCELKYIANTEPVAVGDWVVLAEEEEAWDQPLVLGVVSEANVIPGDPFWQIKVTATQTAANPRIVHVLTEELNSKRVANSRSAILQTQ